MSDKKIVMNLEAIMGDRFGNIQNILFKNVHFLMYVMD